MRTKTILTAAALLAAGALTSMAQSNVFSLNVVGYYNVSLTNGFQLVANQLDLDGTGVNNNATSVFGTTLPNLAKVYAFSGGVFVNVTYVAGTHTFSGNSNAVNAALQPGGGVFVQIPAAAATPITLTVVGNVMQGSLSTPYPAGFSLISSKVPQSGGITTALGFTPGANLDAVFQFLPATQLYGPKHTWVAGTSTWGAGEPTPAVGESVFYQAHVAGSWNRSFTVN